MSPAWVVLTSARFTSVCGPPRKVLQSALGIHAKRSTSKVSEIPSLRDKEWYMKVLRLTFALMLLLQKEEVFSQGTFVNLDFENPILPLVPGRVPITSALPGWTGYNTEIIFYDDISLGAAAISLHDTNGFVPIVQGNYTVLLQGSFPGGAVVPAIGQVGTVPATARSVMFYGGGYTVTFAGQQIPVIAVGS